MSKYKLTGKLTITDGKYTRIFTEKDITNITVVDPQPEGKLIFKITREIV